MFLEYECVVDLAFLIIKEHKLIIPEEDNQLFDILNKEGIISDNLKERLKDLLIADIRGFIQQIKKL